jgi:hypothetical protein
MTSLASISLRGSVKLGEAPFNPEAKKERLAHAGLDRGAPFPKPG